MKKRILTGALALSIVASGTAVFANEKMEIVPISEAISETVENNRILDLSKIETYEKDGTKMVPLRQVAEGILGIEVKWINETQSVEIGFGPQWTSITIDKNSYFFARVAPFELSQAPELKDGLAYVPVEFFTKILKCEIKSEVNVPEYEEQILSGFIKAISDIEGRKRILVGGDEKTTGLDEILLSIADETIIVDKDENEFKVEDLKVGTRIKAVLPQIMTMSLPPQGVAVKVIVENTDVHVEKITDKDNEEIKYPKILGLEEKVENNINKKIEEFVKGIKGNDLFKDLKLDYEISLLSDEKMSIVFYGIYDFNNSEKNLVRSLNFDLETSNEINFANYFKEDEESQKKLTEILKDKAREQLDMEFEAEGKQIYFKGSKVVVFYYPLDDAVIFPVHLYLSLEDVESLAN